MKRGTSWPIAIGGILGLTIAANIWLIRVANGDPTFAIEPDYYRKALHWDDELAQRRHNDALGWTVTPTLSLERRSGMLDVALRDRDGVPVTGASVEVVAVHNTRAADPVAARLAGDGRGHYRAALDTDRPGLWQLRFEIRRGAERFTADLRVEARGGGS
jgi:nitrogen fixation protein FixH